MTTALRAASRHHARPAAGGTRPKRHSGRLRLRSSLALLASATLGTTVLAGAVGMAAPALPAGAATSHAPIVVGGLGDLTVGTGEAQGFEAGITRFNKAGGLDGRKITFVGWLDDGFNPETNLTDAQQLVQNDHVMAVVPMETAVAPAATGTFLAQNKTPFVGWMTNAAFVAAPTWGFGINGNQSNPAVQGVAGLEQLLAATHHTNSPGKAKLALVGENVPGAITSVKAFTGVAKYLGMKVVYNQSPIPVSGATNYAPYAQDLISSGADIIYEITDAPNGTGLAAALESAGYHGIIVNGSTYYPGQLAGQPNEAQALDGVYVENEFPADENHTPAVKQAQADLEATGQKPYLTQGVSIGYWSAIVFEQMLKATLAAVGGNPAKVTGTTLQETVAKGFTYTDPLAGGIGTEHFPAAETVPTGCGTLLKTTGTTYAQVEPYQCPGSVDVAERKTVSQLTGKPTR